MSIEMSKLKPCPFCGFAAIESVAQDASGKLYQAVAWLCCGGGYRVSVKIWNSRHSDHEVEAMREVCADVLRYKQAISDHSTDPCQCRNKKSCLGDCGPSNAVKLLVSLNKLSALSAGNI